MSTSVAKPSANYETYETLWTKVRDASAGHDRIQGAGVKYLPKLPGQDEIKGSYDKYLKGALFYGATGRTLQGYLGLLFRKDPEANLPDVVEKITDDITLTGKSLQKYAKLAATEELKTSRFATLVEHPPSPGEDITTAEAQEQGFRPYFVPYRAEDIIGDPKMVKVGNRMVVGQVRLRETYSESGDDEFSPKKKKQIRVLDLAPPPDQQENEDYQGPLYYRQRVFRKKKDVEGEGGDAEYILTDTRYPLMGGELIKEIPIYFSGGHEWREPWMIDLANTNIHHYQTYADYTAGVVWTTRPQPYVTGQNKDNLDGDFYLGAGDLWVFPEDGRVGMLEYSGSGLSAAEKKLDDLKQDMATLGARMLVPEKRAAETAEAHSIKREGENSALSEVADMSSEMITNALDFAARWMGAQDAEIEYRLNKDYLPIEMPVQDIIGLWRLYLDGGITIDDYLWNLKQGERVDPTVDNDDRQAEMQTQSPTGLPGGGVNA